MTARTQDAPVAVASGLPPRSRLGRTLLVAAVVAAAVAASAVVGWWVVAQSTLERVRIVYDAVPVRCDGTTVGVTPAIEESDETPFDEEFHSPVVDVADGMSCAIRLHVVNESGEDVQVERVGMPGAAESMADSVVPAFVNPNGQRRVADAEEAAEFLIEGVSVPANGSQAFLIVIESAGGDDYDPCTSTKPRAPYVVASFAGVTKQVASADTAGIWYRFGTHEECVG